MSIVSNTLSGAHKAIKAIYATLIAGLGSLSAVLVEPDATIGAVTQGQWVVIALASLVAGGGVYGLTNKP